MEAIHLKITKQLNKRRSTVTPFDVSILPPDPLWWTPLPTSLLSIAKASYLKLITILLPFDKAVVPPRSTVYEFYTRYCNDIKALVISNNNIHS